MSYFFLTAEEIIRIHDNILKEEPGLPGISRDKSLDGALGRIESHSNYSQVNDIHDIAALYCIAIAQGHVFNDGNKRTSLMAMYAFLKTNGFTLFAEENETKEIILAVAQKKISMHKLANWLRVNTVNLLILNQSQRGLKKKGY